MGHRCSKTEKLRRLKAWQAMRSTHKKKEIAEYLGIKSNTFSQFCTNYDEENLENEVAVAQEEYDKLMAKCETVVAAYRSYPTKQDAADSIGMGWHHFDRALKVAIEEGFTLNKPAPDIDLPKSPVAAVAPVAEPMDRVRLRKAKNDLKAARAEINELQDMITAMEDFKADVLDLLEVPLEPLPIEPVHGTLSSLSWIIGIFDYHLGKRMSRAEVFGLQDYDVQIATDRIHRQFAISARLIREHSEFIDRIVVVCGGDNANGELRDDDKRSNEVPPMMQAKLFAEAVISGVEHLLEEFHSTPIEVANLPGNHGRTDKMPPHYAIGQNWDILAGWLITKHFQGNDRVRVSCAEDVPDVVISVYNKAIFTTHGDRIGSNGGDGQIGALGPTKRGSLKISSQYEAIRAYVPDMPSMFMTLMGHFHYYWTDMRVMVSGAGIGVDPWSLTKLRVRPAPPVMPLLGFHRTKGLVFPLTVFPGHPDEGPLLADPWGKDVQNAARAAGL